MNGDGVQYLFCANYGNNTVSVLTNTLVAVGNVTTYTTNSVPMTNVVVTATGTTNLNFSGSFTGNGSGLINLPVNAITGGFTTNIVIGGHTFYITNGIIMNVQ